MNPSPATAGIPWERLNGLPGADGPCDFAVAFDRKLPVIEEAAANFLDNASPEAKLRFQQFCRDNISWLTDWAMYFVLRRRFAYASWNDWPIEYATRQPDALSNLLNESSRELAIEQVVQFFFAEQWTALRCYCADRKISILGDVAIFVSYDSADVWTHPEIFELDQDRKPIRVSGVPPDYFSATGQRWGNPLYKWSLLQEHGFDWWVARIRRALTLYDEVRLDHFRGFEAYWSIPADEETAMNGQWVKAPARPSSPASKRSSATSPSSPKTSASSPRKSTELRRVLRHARHAHPAVRLRRPRRPSLPPPPLRRKHRRLHRHARQQHHPRLVARRRHRNRAHQRPDLPPHHRARRRHRLGHDQVRRRVGRRTCIFPLQDILHLGSDARMNVPAAPVGNWTWRYAPDALHPDFAAKLSAIMAMTDRDGYQKPVEGPTAAAPPTKPTCASSKAPKRKPRALLSGPEARSIPA